jgi:hypothetical protein
MLKFRTYGAQIWSVAYFTNIQLLMELLYQKIFMTPGKLMTND